MSYLVRTVHVGSVSFLFGGALLLFLLFVTGRAKGDHSSFFELLRVYEIGFWIAVGLTAMTGVGNLGALGKGLPAFDSEWGHELALKLTLVFVLLLFSVVRTLSVALAGVSTIRTAFRAPPALQGLYGATAVLLASIVAVAIALAHY